MASTPTHASDCVPIAFVHGVTAGWRARQVDLRRCFVDAGLAPVPPGDPLARVTTKQYVSLIRAMVRNFDDEGLGFYGRRLRRGTTALILRAGLGPGTLGDSARKLSDAFNLLQDDMRIVSSVAGTTARFQVLALSTSWPQRQFATEMVLRVLFRCITWLHDDRLPQLTFEFEMARPPQWPDYAGIFPGMARFGQARTSLLFDAFILERAVRRDEAQLRDVLEQLPDGLVLPLRAEGSAAARVRKALQRARPAWPDLADVAAGMHMSPSTLKRHLAGEGLTFQALKDQLRLEMALMRLETGRVPLAAVAGELGFSDCATFQRAFKSWTGTTPGGYRARVLESLA